MIFKDISGGLVSLMSAVNSPNEITCLVPPGSCWAPRASFVASSFSPGNLALLVYKGEATREARGAKQEITHCTELKFPFLRE